MNRSIHWICAILASVGMVAATAQPLARPEAVAVNLPAPHPEEVRLLDELEAWNWAEVETPGHDHELSVLAAPERLELVCRPHEDANWLERESLPFAQEIGRVAQRHRLDALLLAAIVEAESSFRSDALSPTGATGLMQVLPATAASLGIEDVLDPDQNLDAGARYLGRLLDRYDGDLPLALAAYNAGPTRVRRYGGIPPFPETERYVGRVLRRYAGFRRAVWRSRGLPAPPERAVPRDG